MVGVVATTFVSDCGCCMMAVGGGSRQEWWLGVLLERVVSDFNKIVAGERQFERLRKRSGFDVGANKIFHS